MADFKDMTKADIVDLLGEPDHIIPPGGPRRTADAWKCFKCGRVVEEDRPIPNPAPCVCGCIGFVVVRKAVN